MADNVEVRIVADGSAAKSSMSDTSTSISASLDGIKTALENFGSKNKDTVNEAIQNNANLSRSFMELKGSATGGFNAIAGVIERFRGVLVGLTAALAGGFIGKEAVSEMLKLEDAVRGLSISFGMTTEKATQTAIALKLAGISADTYEQMGQRVGRVLKTQSEEFARLGVVTKDASGNLLPMDQILQNIFTRMQDFKAGTDQTEFALSTVGRNAKDFASDMLRLNAATERAAQLQHDLGIEMGPERIAAIEKYRQDVNAFTVVLGAIGDKIGEEVLPNLEKLAGWFNEYGPTAIKVIVDAVKVLISILQILGTILGTAAIYAKGAFDDIVVSAQATGRILKAQFTGDWGSIPGIVAEANAKIIQINQITTESIVQSWQDAVAKIKNLWASASPAAAGGAGPMKSGSQHFTPKPTGGGGDGAMGGLENELKAEEDAFNRKMLLQGSFQVWSITQTRDYWEEVLTMTNLSAKDRQEAENKYYDAERKVQTESFAALIASLEAKKSAIKGAGQAQIDIATQIYNLEVQRYGEQSVQAQMAYKQILEARQKLKDEIIKVAEIQTKEEEAHYTHMLDMAKLDADQQVALGKISNAQRLSMESDFESQMYSKKLAALEQQLSLLTIGTAAYEEQNAKILALEDAHQKAMTELANKATLDRQQYALQADRTVESSFASLFANLATGTMTAKQAFLDFFKSLDTGLAKIASDQVAKQLFGAGTSGGSFISSITSKIFGGGAGADAGTAIAETANTSALALLTAAVTANTVALGTASASGALSAGGGAFSSLLGGGFGDIIPSFAVGTAYVPQDSLAMVHKGEAIIPAKYNNSGLSSSGGLMQVHNHFMISGPIDSRTQDQISEAAARSVHRATARIGA